MTGSHDTPELWVLILEFDSCHSFDTNNKGMASRCLENFCIPAVKYTRSAYNYNGGNMKFGYHWEPGALKASVGSYPALLVCNLKVSFHPLPHNLSLL